MENRFKKGLLIGVCFQNFFLIIFLVIISTPDGFDFLGLAPIWFIVMAFTISTIIYYNKKEDSA